MILILAYIASLYAPLELSRLIIIFPTFTPLFILELSFVWIVEICLGYFIVKKL